MRPEVNSNHFEISNHFEMLFRLQGTLHGHFTAATFQTIARFRGRFRVQNYVVTKCCKIDTIYIEVIALIFVVIVVVIIIIVNVAILFCFEILVVTA